MQDPDQIAAFQVSQNQDNNRPRTWQQFSPVDLLLGIIYMGDHIGGSLLLRNFSGIFVKSLLFPKKFLSHLHFRMWENLGLLVNFPRFSGIIPRKSEENPGKIPGKSKEIPGKP